MRAPHRGAPAFRNPQPVGRWPLSSAFVSDLRPFYLFELLRRPEREGKPRPSRGISYSGCRIPTRGASCRSCAGPPADSASADPGIFAANGCAHPDLSRRRRRCHHEAGLRSDFALQAGDGGRGPLHTAEPCSPRGLEPGRFLARGWRPAASRTRWCPCGDSCTVQAGPHAPLCLLIS